MTKALRVIEANRVLEAVGSCGRRFFYSGPDAGEPARRDIPSGRYAHFEMGARGQLWFRDDWSWKLIAVCQPRSDWHGFSHGGTLRGLVQALRDYIRTGKPVNAFHFGPWSWTRDHWGYHDGAMDRLRCLVADLPAVAPWTAHRDLTSVG